MDLGKMLGKGVSHLGNVIEYVLDPTLGAFGRNVVFPVMDAVGNNIVFPAMAATEVTINGGAVLAIAPEVAAPEMIGIGGTAVAAGVSTTALIVGGIIVVCIIGGGAIYVYQNHDYFFGRQPRCGEGEEIKRMREQAEKTGAKDSKQRANTSEIVHQNEGLKQENSRLIEILNNITHRQPQTFEANLNNQFEIFKAEIDNRHDQLIDRMNETLENQRYFSGNRAAFHANNTNNPPQTNVADRPNVRRRDNTT